MTLHYRINPDGHIGTGTHPPLTQQEAIGAITAAARVWMDADPTVRLVYDGTTEESLGSGNNVIGFAVDPRGTPVISIASAVHVPRTADRDRGFYSGFDIFIDPKNNFSWDPCDPPNGDPCESHEDDGVPPDLQGVMVHEWGHVLGLGHAEPEGDEPGSLYVEMTMRSGPWRPRVTLGLGDVLGVRSLYPTKASMPTLYRP